MFIVFNKQKIYSYLIALGTVVILFVIAFSVTAGTQNTVQTSGNTQSNLQSNIQTNSQNVTNIIVQNNNQQ